MNDVDLREPIATAVHEFVRLVRELPPGSLGDPTPCAEYDVRGLLNHVLYWGPRLAAAARREPPPPADGGEEAAGLVTEDWRGRLAKQTEDLAAALREDAAWSGTTSMGGGELPAGMVGSMALAELVVHGWDLGVATGTRFDCPRAVADAAEPVMRAMAAQGREMNVFGPEVPVSAGASSLERLLGVSGRDPAWQP